MLKKIIEVKVMISMTKTNLALCCFYIILDLTQGLPYLETGIISLIVDIKEQFYSLNDQSYSFTFGQSRRSKIERYLALAAAAL